MQYAIFFVLVFIALELWAIGDMLAEIKNKNMR